MFYNRISIVTPTYNSESYLEETILSVITQDYPDLEYIIIDGGSTDGTIEIIKKYESHLTYWESSKDSGMYHAIHKGFQKSTGKIMAWINSDDKYLPNSFFVVNQIFCQFPNINWIQGQPLWYNRSGEISAIYNHSKWSKYKLWAGSYKWIQQESVFWCRDAWENSGGYIDISYKYAGDLELWFRFIKNNDLYNVTIPLSGFRSHPDQITKRFFSQYEEEAKKIVDSFHVPSVHIGKFSQVKRIQKLRKMKITKWLNYFLQINQLLQKLENQYHKYPSDISYNFVDQKWELH
jgi:glycosyltransferase involved in cell wall biosynthesis